MPLRRPGCPLGEGVIPEPNGAWPMGVGVGVAIVALSGVGRGRMLFA